MFFILCFTNLTNFCVHLLVCVRRTIQRGKEAQKRARESAAAEAEAEAEAGKPSAKRGRKGDSTESKPLTHNEKKAARAHRYKENLRRRHRAGAIKARAASDSAAAGKRPGKQ